MYDNDSMAFRLERSMTNQTPTPEQVGRIEELRSAAKFFGAEIILRCPSSPDRTHALRQLEDALMWAVKAIVLEEAPTATS